MSQVVYNKNVIADKSTGITIVPITQSAYNALSEAKKKDKTKMYVTSGESSSLMQVFYDMVHPVDEVVIGFTSPTVPAGVVAVWDDITSEFEGRSIWFSSTAAAGSTLDGLLPNITGTAELEFYGSLPRPVINTLTADGAFTTGGDTSNKTYLNGYNQATGSSQQKLGFNASKSNTVYSGTDSTVRPTSVVCKVYRRVS